MQTFHCSRIVTTGTALSTFTIEMNSLIDWRTSMNLTRFSVNKQLKTSLLDVFKEDASVELISLPGYPTCKFNIKFVTLHDEIYSFFIN